LSDLLAGLSEEGRAAIRRARDRLGEIRSDADGGWVDAVNGLLVVVDEVVTRLGSLGDGNPVEAGPHDEEMTAAIADLRAAVNRLIESVDALRPD
jgi:hypothetical protein